MADSKITALAALTAADPANDMFPVVDVSDTSMAASGTTKRISINNILACSPSATLASATITGDLTVRSGNKLILNRADNAISSQLFDAGGGAGLTVNNLNGDGFLLKVASNNVYQVSSSYVQTWYDGAGGTRMTLNATGLGVGVTPSAWVSYQKSIDFGGAGNYGSVSARANFAAFATNCYFDGTNWIYKNTNPANLYEQSAGANIWRTAPSGTAGTAITGANAFVQAMTLDASGNLLVGATSGTYHTIRKNVTADAGNAVLEVAGNAGATVVAFYGVSSYGANAANAATKVGRDATTLRSINAGGTVNASGADYAEYMTKASDFVLSKGGIAGIDANGKLTNVFADAVSFAVKSTDPSYVGNDKWGVDLEGDALEAARQLVDRIAFAGQVPVNVTGAKAGDYIVPVVDGTGIKGIAVSNPTFEQYQIAVGKVIAIDADGRARIIVKVA